MPENKDMSITDMTQKAYDRILQENYFPKTNQQYWYCGVIPVRRYCEQREIEIYSPESICDCVDWFCEQYKQGTIYPQKFQKVRKIADIMECIAKGESYQWQPLSPWHTVQLPPLYSILLEDYAEHMRKNGYRETTIRGAKPIVKHFLIYVSSLGYESIRSITQTDVVDYIPELCENYHCVGDALSILRAFGNYLYERELVKADLVNVLSVRVSSRKKLHVGFTQEEATEIVTGIDRSTVCGKRDYAILMLAMHTGLRGIDVLGLTFKNIQWEKQEIHLTQSKTTQALILPVPVSVLNAIAEYILYARPESQEKNVIFLRTRKPYLPMKTWSAYSIVKRNATQAGITWSANERKGFHSFRRSIASWMLDEKVPLEMITEVLGQRETDSTKPYIAVHQSGLAECALDLQSIPIGRRELR